jgi:hypothetical protein
MTSKPKAKTRLSGRMLPIMHAESRCSGPAEHCDQPSIANHNSVES